MESIGSGEVFPNVELSVGEAPKHTQEGHENCAYSWVDDVMLCEHGKSVLAGGFYSEDYIRDVKHQVHKAIAFIDRYVEFNVKSWSQNARLDGKYIPMLETADFQHTIELLRDLTK